MTFGENLKALRLGRMMNQGKVADGIHVSRSTYSQYERGTRQPSLDIVYSIAQFYGIRIDALFHSENHKFISDVNYYTSISDQEKKLLACFERLSAFGKGRLLERAEVLEAEDVALFPQSESKGERSCIVF